MNHQNSYKEAMRYIENADDNLKLAGKDGKYYIDDKYVKTACGTAYSGLLKALDFLFAFKGTPNTHRRKSIQYYQNILSGIDKKLLDNLNTSYRILHLEGYYEGERKMDVIKSGFDSAVFIISALKPYSKNGDE